LSSIFRCGARLHAALKAEKPLQIVGVINAYAARLAERAGFRAVYLSGGGVAAASLGVPDLGISTLEDVLMDARRITDITGLPLLVDVDTGFGSAFNIARTIRSLEKAGAAAVHIEDQVQAKRCGHRPGKALVSKAEMVDRIKAAVDARSDLDFGIMARTDALAVEGLPAALERAGAYIEAGADYLFPEALTDPAMYAEFARAGVPVLANMTEFGQSPLHATETLAAPPGRYGALPAFGLPRHERGCLARLRNNPAGRRPGRILLTRCRPAPNLYEILNYHFYEQKLDELFEKEKIR
jgi:methylisocitrate lyase